MSIQYYTLPQNTSGAVNIPIFNTPTPLAFITVTPGPGNDIGSVRANIGWQALTGRTTQVIFKIWQVAPVTGTLISSADDSAVVKRGVVTSFSHVYSGFTTAQTNNCGSS